MKRLFFHGLEGSINGTKAKEFSELGYKAVDWQKIYFKESLNIIIEELIDEDDEIMLVGSSLGALLVNQIASIINGCGVVYINPPVNDVTDKSRMRFKDIDNFNWLNIADLQSTTFVSKHDEVFDPVETKKVLDITSHIIEIDDTHRASSPKTLELIKKEIVRLEDTIAL